MSEWGWVSDALAAERIVSAPIFIGGSIARGWCNPGSDVDAYVLNAPHDVKFILEFGEGRPLIDVHAISAPSLDTLFAKVSWEVAAAGDFVDSVTIDEWLLLERIAHPLLVSGSDAMAQIAGRLLGSAHRFMSIQEHFTYADSFVQDCLGQLAINDDDSAVISAQESFFRALDGMLCGRGMFSRNPKWRSRAVRDAATTPSEYADYWEIQTMTALPSMGAKAWSRRTVARARDLMAEVELHE